jgi:hypothetical protein
MLFLVVLGVSKVIREFLLEALGTAIARNGRWKNSNIGLLKKWHQAIGR